MGGGAGSSGRHHPRLRPMLFEGVTDFGKSNLYTNSVKIFSAMILSSNYGALHKKIFTRERNRGKGLPALFLQTCKGEVCSAPENNPAKARPHRKISCSIKKLQNTKYPPRRGARGARTDFAEMQRSGGVEATRPGGGYTSSSSGRWWPCSFLPPGRRPPRCRCFSAGAP